MTPASAQSLIEFDFILLGVVAMLIAGYHRVKRDPRRTITFALGLLVWFGATGAIATSGWAAESPFPRLMLILGFINLVSLGAALSPIGRDLALGTPLRLLVLFQGFRFPLELVLHSWAAQGVIPGTMTWTGSNYDVVSGALVLLAAPFANHRVVAWAVNGVGSVLLLNVMRVAVLSSPLPFAWNVTPPLLLAFHLPYSWIVPVCVGGALFGHVVLTRALLTKRA